MNATEFTEILNKKAYDAGDVSKLEALIDKYPWFALPRFLKLRALRSSGEVLPEDAIKQTALFSGNRAHLYQWLNEQEDAGLKRDIFQGKELEFIVDTSSAVMSDNSDTTFQDSDNDSVSSDHEDGKVDDAELDERVIDEKDEADMEDPEIEPIGDLPVIDSIEQDEQEDPVPEDQPVQDEQEGLSVDNDKSEDIEKRVNEASAGGIENSPEEAKEIVPETPVSEVDKEVISLEGVDFLSEEPTDAEKPENVDSEEEKTGKDNVSNKLITDFLQSDPGVIRADKETSLEGDISEESIKEDDSNISDTLAKIYVTQGLHAKAIYAYERLSLKYPEKSAYFAAQIEKIKSISNL